MAVRKYIVFYDEDSGKAEHLKIEEEDNSWNDVHEFNKWTFVRKFLFDKGFRMWLLRTIQYALRHHECWRGTGASDVVLFQHYIGNIFKRNEK